MDQKNSMQQIERMKKDQGQECSVQKQRILSRLLNVSLLLGVVTIITGCVTYGLGVGLGSHGHSSVSVGATVHAHPRRKSHAKRADRRTHKQVIKILSGYRLNTRQIRVKVNRGLVTLHGIVQSSDLEHDIIRRIARLPGVHTVRSKMHVRVAYR